MSYPSNRRQVPRSAVQDGVEHWLAHAHCRAAPLCQVWLSIALLAHPWLEALKQGSLLRSYRTTSMGTLVCPVQQLMRSCSHTADQSPSQLRPTLASQAHLWAERSTMGSPFC